MYPYITITGEIKIPLYTTVFVIAFLVATGIAYIKCEKYNLARIDLIFGVIYGAIGLFLGAKLFFFFSKLPKIFGDWNGFVIAFKTDPLYMFSYLFGGLVFYGGLIGFVCGILLYCKIYKVDVMPFINVAPPYILAVHGCGRIGCFLAGCCYGMEYHGPFSVQFPYNPIVEELSQVPRFPVQLLEAGMNFAMCALLILLMKIKKDWKNGQLMGIYVVYYAIARFCPEMLRGDIVRGKFGTLTTSQLISVILLPLGIILISGKFFNKKEND